MPEAYIVEAVRTAGGRRGGRLAGVHPVDLAATSLDAVMERSGLEAKAVDDVVMGCVSQGGEQAMQVGRNAVLASKHLGEGVPAVTIDRQCGSSQQAIPVRRAGGDERHAGRRHRRGCREHEPRAHGLDRDVPHEGRSGQL